MIETHLFAFGKHGESYRLRPNPDVVEGFKGGAYLSWKNLGESAEEYTNREIFVSPEVLEDMSEMFATAAREVASD